MQPGSRGGSWEGALHLRMETFQGRSKLRDRGHRLETSQSPRVEWAFRGKWAEPLALKLNAWNVGNRPDQGFLVQNGRPCSQGQSKSTGHEFSDLETNSLATPPGQLFSSVGRWPRWRLAGQAGRASLAPWQVPERRGTHSPSTRAPATVACWCLPAEAPSHRCGALSSQPREGLSESDQRARPSRGSPSECAPGALPAPQTTH